MIPLLLSVALATEPGDDTGDTVLPEEWAWVEAHEEEHQTDAVYRTLHPTVQLLDTNSQPVGVSGEPVSPMRTCGTCHDTEYIEANSFHSQLGADEMFEGEHAGRPWDTSPGAYGRWNASTYRVLGEDDMSRDEWVGVMAPRHVGGGPAAPEVEMDCFLCHTSQPDNAARIAARQSGEARWSATATLLYTGLVEHTAEGWTWNVAPDSRVSGEDLGIRPARRAACEQCHTAVPDGQQRLDAEHGRYASEAQGQVYAWQRVSASAMNIEGRDDKNRPWDVHAERLLQCTSCHYSVNNPSYYRERDATQPGHLQFDGRRLSVGEYLRRPSHQLAKGYSAQGTVADRLDGTMRRCEDCHDASSTHAWLPFSTRHFNTLHCESCHVPEVIAPVRETIDWTLLDADREPVATWRGIEGEPGDADALITGSRPVLLARETPAGRTRLTPHNLVGAWYWMAGDRPVRQADLEVALFKGEGYHPDVLAALDEDGDGTLSSDELRLDTDAKVAAVAARLEAVGVQEAHISGEIQPYGLHHTVATGEWAVKSCTDCHEQDGTRLGSPEVLASFVPGGVIPELVADANVALNGVLEQDDEGRLVYTPVVREAGFYVLGHDRWAWIDIVGILGVLGSLGAAAVHGGLRFIAHRRQVTPSRQGRSA